MQIIEIVQQLVKEKRKDVKVSFGWWASFRKRYSDLTLQTTKPVFYICSVGTRHDIISRYFDLLE